MKKFMGHGEKSILLRGRKSYWRQDIRTREYFELIGKGTGLLFVFALVFYNSLYATFFLAPVCGLWIYREYMELLNRKKREWSVQFQSMIQAVGSALRVGYALENAVVEARDDLKRLYSETGPAMRELDYMIGQIRMHVPVEQALVEMGERTDDEDARNFALVCKMARRSGGDMIGVIRRAVGRMSERLELRREAETLIAAKKLEFQIMSVIPLGMLCYMRLSFPGFMKILYGNLVGILFMSICLAVYLAAYAAGGRIARPEVDR